MNHGGGISRSKKIPYHLVVGASRAGLGMFAVQHRVIRCPSRWHSRVFSLLFHRHHHAAPFVVCERLSPTATTVSLLPSGAWAGFAASFHLERPQRRYASPWPTAAIAAGNAAVFRLP